MRLDTDVWPGHPVSNKGLYVNTIEMDKFTGRVMLHDNGIE